MSRSRGMVLGFCLCFIAVFSVSLGAVAQESGKEPDWAPLEIGSGWGRVNASTGPQVEMNVNGVISGLSVWTLAGYTKHVDHNAPYLREGEKSLFAGLGVTYYPPRSSWRHVHLGGFGQVIASQTGTSAEIPIPDAQPMIFRDTALTPIYTLGPELSFRVLRGPRLVFRTGKNFGPSLAAQTEGGWYFSVNVFADPFSVSSRIRDGARLFRHF